MTTSTMSPMDNTTESMPTMSPMDNTTESTLGHLDTCTGNASCNATGVCQCDAGFMETDNNTCEEVTTTTTTIASTTSTVASTVGNSSATTQSLTPTTTDNGRLKLVYHP